MPAVREASSGDLDRIAEIYNYYIRNSCATFREKELTREEMRTIYEPSAKEYVFLVAEDGADGIVGFAYSSPFRTASAYRLAETTIYLAPECLHRGFGKELYTELILRTARKRPELTGLVAVITGTNGASIRFHEKMNYHPAGRIGNAGCKFDTLLDITFWHCTLKP